MHEQRIKIGEGGRLVIPAFFRKKLNVRPGDELVISIDEGEIRLFHQKQALEKIRSAVKKHAMADKNHTNDFLKFRKKDSGK